MRPMYGLTQPASEGDKEWDGMQYCLCLDSNSSREITHGSIMRSGSVGLLVLYI
jgi:hypothetical protein